MLTHGVVDGDEAHVACSRMLAALAFVDGGFEPGEFVG